MGGARRLVLGSGVGRFRVVRNPCDDKHHQYVAYACCKGKPASTQHIITHPSGVFKLNSIPSSQKESSSKACDDSRRTTDALVPPFDRSGAQRLALMLQEPPCALDL